MRPMNQRKWHELTYIEMPDDLKELIKKCKNLDRDLDLLELCLTNQIMFPGNYLISARVQIHGILTSYLRFIRDYIKDIKELKKVEEDLQTVRTSLDAKEQKMKSEINDRQKYFFEMQLYINIYKEFLHSYIFDTMMDAETEYIKGIKLNIANIMMRKAGILRLLPPPEEEKKGLKIMTKGEESAD